MKENKQTVESIEQRVKELETPAFLRALAALQTHRPAGLCTVGDTDSWIASHVDSEAAAAWRAYKNVEDLLP